MSGRAPKRIKADSAAGESSRGESSVKGLQLLAQPEPTKSGHHSLSQADPESDQTQSQSVWTRREMGSGLQPPGKMLLPPLPKSRTDYAASSRKEKNRTSHACNRCRKAKSKCSGGQPCENCRAEGDACIYGDGKRDKERKENEKLHSRNQRIEQRSDQLVKALLKFSSELDPIKRREFEALLMSLGYGNDEHDDVSTDLDSDIKGPDPQGFMMQGEDNTGAEVGSPGSLDINNEDTDRDEHTRAAGFLGKSSAVSWVQRAKKAAAHDLESERGVPSNVGTVVEDPFTDSAYHAESGDILTVDAAEVNAFEWPPQGVLWPLVDSYFEKVHVSFPILSKSDFYKKLETFPKDEISTEDQCWLATANMVFAIGAKFGHLTNACSRGDGRDHLVYYARARASGMDYRTLNQDPNVQHTAYLGVLGLYLLITDQLSRSWTVCGIALRHAMALGLHVRSEAKDLCDMDKELRVRLWWSLYCLERLLDELTGRPSCVSDRDISTPLPINVDESSFRRDSPLYERRVVESIKIPRTREDPKAPAIQIPRPATFSSPSIFHSMASTTPTGSPVHTAHMFPIVRLPINSSTYFIYRTQLSILSHEILSQLYCAALVKAKWRNVQDTIRDIDSRLLKWKASLPEEFDISQPPIQPDSLDLHRTGLSMFYNSSRMTLFRPCLCRFEGRILNQSERSKTFDSSCAATCIESARNILALLPPISEPAKVYTITAWWNIVHYIVEAGSVLMLELAYRAEHLPSQAEEILADAKKAVLWLRAMSDQSIAARKSWEIFNSLLERVAPKVGGKTSDMPKTAPVPPGWRWNRFGTGSKPERGGENSSRSVNQESEPYLADSNREQEHVNQITYNLQRDYSAPNVPHPIDNYDATGGIAPDFLIGLYPFNGMYDRYDEFGPLRAQNTHFSHGAIQNSYQYASIYPSTEGGSHSMANNPGAIVPQLLTMGQVQLGGEMGGFVNGGYDDPSTTTVPGQDFGMAEYSGWNVDPNSGGDEPYARGGRPSRG